MSKSRKISRKCLKMSHIIINVWDLGNVSETSKWRKLRRFFAIVELRIYNNSANISKCLDYRQFQIIYGIFWFNFKFSKMYLTVLLFWKFRISISDRNRNRFGRTFDVVEDESGRNCVNDILVQSLDCCLRVPGAGEEAWGFCEALGSIWRVFNFDF